MPTIAAARRPAPSRSRWRLRQHRHEAIAGQATADVAANSARGPRYGFWAPMSAQDRAHVRQARTSSE